jgi:hypothetical protein
MGATCCVNNRSFRIRSHTIFFRIDADADLPIPKEPKQEYAKLKSSEL